MKRFFLLYFVLYMTNLVQQNTKIALAYFWNFCFFSVYRLLFSTSVRLHHVFYLYQLHDKARIVNIAMILMTICCYHVKKLWCKILQDWKLWNYIRLCRLQNENIVASQKRGSISDIFQNMKRSLHICFP